MTAQVAPASPVNPVVANPAAPAIADTSATTQVATTPAGEEIHTGFLGDPVNWVAISFVIFAVLFVKFGLRTALGKLDGRIGEIRSELQTAEKLRREAEDMLATYQQRHRDAMQEAQTIADNAKRQAATIQAKAEADLKETMERRERQLTERLARIEAAAEAELRKATAEIALKASESLIRKSLDAKAQNALADKAIANLSGSLN